MITSPGVILKAVLLIAGLWWCKEIFVRLPSDINELRESDKKFIKAVILFYWILTVGIIILIGKFVWGLISNIIEALG